MEGQERERGDRGGEVEGGRALALDEDSVRRGRIEAVEQLFREAEQRGQDDVALANSRYGLRQSALHVAAQEGHFDLVCLLLQHGAHINALDKNHWTPLHCAAKEHLEICQVLLEHGADVAVLTDAGTSAFHYLVRAQVARGQQGLHRTTLALMLRSGQALDVQNESGETPLHQASLAGRVESVAWLLEHGAALHCANKYGETALHFAARNGSEEVVALLLAAGADAAVEGAYGTPRAVAENFNQAHIVALLDQWAADGSDSDDGDALAPLLELQQPLRTSPSPSPARGGGPPHPQLSTSRSGGLHPQLSTSLASLGAASLSRIPSESNGSGSGGSGAARGLSLAQKRRFLTSSRLSASAVRQPPPNGPARTDPRQRRLRHVRGILVRSIRTPGPRRLPDTYFTLSVPSGPDGAHLRTIFTSTVRERSLNPSWTNVALEQLDVPAECRFVFRLWEVDGDGPTAEAAAVQGLSGSLEERHSQEQRQEHRTGTAVTDEALCLSPTDDDDDTEEEKRPSGGHGRENEEEIEEENEEENEEARGEEKVEKKEEEEEHEAEKENVEDRVEKREEVEEREEGEEREEKREEEREKEEGEGEALYSSGHEEERRRQEQKIIEREMEAAASAAAAAPDDSPEAQEDISRAVEEGDSNSNDSSRGVSTGGGVGGDNSRAETEGQSGREGVGGSLVLEVAFRLHRLAFVAERLLDMTCPDNLLVLELADGYYVREDLALFLQPPSSSSRPPASQEARKKMYKLGTVKKILAAQARLEDVHRRSAKLEQEAAAGLALHRRLLALRRRRDRLQAQTDALRRSTREFQLRLDSEKEHLERSRDAILPRAQQLNKALLALVEDKQQLAARREALEAKKARLADLQELVAFRRSVLIRQLRHLLPISQTPDQKALCINKIRLPNSDFAGCDEELVATALGLVCQMLQLISKWLDVPLRYRLEPMASRSAVRDEISTKQHHSSRFPLHARGVERTRFDYGVYLLNKNVEQLLNSQGLDIITLRHTLANLQLFLISCGKPPTRVVAQEDRRKTIRAVLDRKKSQS